MAQRRALKDTVNDPMVKKEVRAGAGKAVRAGAGRKPRVTDQREIAKAGMISSLGTLVISGFFKFNGAKMLHTWAGWALLGFSIWHHMLSSSKSKSVSDR